jgi:hypothetical protein
MSFVFMHKVCALQNITQSAFVTLLLAQAATVEPYLRSGAWGILGVKSLLQQRKRACMRLYHPVAVELWRVTRAYLTCVD